MKHYLYVTAILFFVSSANANLGNPCNTGMDCINSRAEEVIKNIQAHADLISQISQLVDSSDTREEAQAYIQHGQEILRNAYEMRRNFSGLLGIENHPDSVAVSGRYSSFVHKALLTVETEMAVLRGKVRFRHVVPRE